MGRLQISKGSEIGIEYELDEVTEIGRSSECTIQLLDQSVSRRHARIVKREKSWLIENISGTSEVRVNGVKIQEPLRLMDRDEITVGEYHFIFNSDLTLVRANDDDRVLVLSPHKPKTVKIENLKGDGSLKESSLILLNAICERCLTLEDGPLVLRETIQDIVQHFEMEKGFIALFKNEQCQLAAATGDAQSMIVSKTIIQSIRQEAKIIISLDACRDVQGQQGLSLVQGKVRTVVCAPLLAGSRVLGFLQVDSSGALQKLPPDTRLFLEKVAKALGGFLRRHERKEPLLALEEPEPGLIASSGNMRQLIEHIHQAAESSSTCLIAGETGTGKELVAKMIHRLSLRKDNPFIAVNCAAIPETIIESELFGFEKGSFTGAYKSTPGKIELADTGSLFLDEIGDMSPYAQAKLLRFLQERVFYRIGAKRYTRVDVRIIAATNKDLWQEVQQGRFREDLYYRLAVIPLYVPPLRERRQDIVLLAEQFLNRFCRELKKSPVVLSARMIERLLAHEWPGNVRELRNLMERFAVLGREPATLSAGWKWGPGKNTDLSKGHEEEKARIMEALKRHQGNKSKAALALGLSRPTLDSKIKKYDIDIYR